MAERQKKPLSVNSFSVKITVGTATINAFFSKCSGLEKTYNTGNYSDGQSNVVYKLPGSVEYSNVTLSKAFTEDDDAIVTALLAANSSNTDFITVDIQPVYRDGYYTKAIGGSVSAKYCTLASLKFPDIDTSGSDAAMLEFVLSPGYVDSAGTKQFWKEPVSA
jgi:hypothetical protein